MLAPPTRGLRSGGLAKFQLSPPHSLEMGALLFLLFPISPPPHPFVVSTERRFNQTAPGPPLFSCFCFLPPSLSLRSPGPPTLREIKNAPPYAWERADRSTWVSCANRRTFCVTCRKTVTNRSLASLRATRPRAYSRTQRSVVRATVRSATPCEAACGDGRGHKSRVTRCHALNDLSRMRGQPCMQQARGGWPTGPGRNDG